MIRKKLSPFGLVLEILNVPVTALSYAIHVDQSLISKWKSGDRILKNNSEHFVNVLDFFVKENASQNLRALENFFAGVYPSEEKGDGEGAVRQSLVKFLSQSDLAPETQNLYLQAKETLYNATFSVYNGVSGRRNAFWVLFNKALAMKKPGEIYIAEKDGFSWLVSDDKYRESWSEQMLLLLKKGFKLNLIAFSSDEKNALPVLAAACPELFFNRATQKFFYPCENRTDVIYSQYLIQDAASAVGFSSSETGAYTALFFDAVTLKTHEHAFKALIARCKTVSRFKTFPEIFEMFETIKKLKDLSGKIYLSNCEMLFFEPDLLEEVLKQNGVGGKTKENCVRLHTLIREAVAGSGAVKVHFLSVDNLKKYAAQRSFDYHILRSVVKKPVVVSNEQFKRHLRNTAELLLQERNVLAALIPTAGFALTGNSQYLCKERLWCLSCDAPGKMGGVRFCEEAQAVKAMADLFNNCYHGISGVYKDKKNIAEFLLSL